MTLSNIYNAVNRYEEATSLMDQMKERGIKKIPGETSVEVCEESPRTFYANDKLESMPQYKEHILAKVRSLN